MRYLLVILITLTYTINSQERFFLRGSAGIYHAIEVESLKRAPFIAKMQPSFSSGFEGLWQREIGKHWRFSTGLLYEYSRLKYKFEFDPVIDPIISAPQGVLLEISEVRHALSTPVYAHFFFGKKRRMLIGLGLAQRFQVITQSDSFILNSDGTSQTFSNSFFDLEYGITSQLEAGYRFKLKNNHEILLMGSIKINPFQNAFFFLNNTFFFEPIHYQTYLTIGYSFIN